MTACTDCLRPLRDNNPSSAGQRNFLSFTSFPPLKSKARHASVSEGMSELRSQEAEPGGATAPTPPVSSIRTMDGGGMEETEDKTPSEHEQSSSVLCDSLHSSVHLAENSPMMRAVLCAQVCKVYRFQTGDRRWLLVREQMSETPLSFSLPRQLLSALRREHTRRARELTELGDLSPHLDRLRRDVTRRCEHLSRCYRETLEELDTPSDSPCFKSSSSKTDRHLQFVPTNLHVQRMEATSPPSPGVWYEVITFGAPADHHQNFKHGGLKRLMSKQPDLTHCVSYSSEEVIRAQDVLRSVARLQPLVFGLSEELLAVSLQEDAALLQEVLKALTQQTGCFVHALKDELVRSALLDVHRTSPAPSDRAHSNGLQCEGVAANQEGRRDGEHQDEQYDEEEWDTAWVNVTKSLNCIVVLVDRLKGRQDRPPLMTSSEPEETGGDRSVQNTASSSSSFSSWQEQLLPLVVTLRDCVREAVGKARVAMTFVVLQGAAASTLAHGPAQVVTRRHAVFSQALAALVCGVMLKLYGALDDPHFLLQLHSVGVLAQFEGLLSTYGDEVGMLEDMEVGVADLNNVAFRITESTTEQPDDLLPTLSGTWGDYVVEVPLPSENFGVFPAELRDGRSIRVEAVLFNIGINQQQSLAERFGDCSPQDRVNQQSSQRLRAYCDSLSERLPYIAGVQSLPDLLCSLRRSLESRKRKNVEVLWTAATICRAANGVRLTSCKSAKDRTAMSVTLEQCALLRERHALGRQHFGAALDCMRRDGCRMENVQKNVGSRKFAFSCVQLLTFPKLYRPPDGSYG